MRKTYCSRLQFWDLLLLRLLCRLIHKGTKDLTITSAFKETPAGRKRCPVGHLIGKRFKTYCQACWDTTSKGRARRHRYKISAKGKAGTKRFYHDKRARGYTAFEAMGIVVPGNALLTQKRMIHERKRIRIGMRLSRQRWGYPDRNFVHRHRQEMIREGFWKAEEHPL